MTWVDAGHSDRSAVLTGCKQHWQVVVTFAGEQHARASTQVQRQGSAELEGHRADVDTLDAVYAHRLVVATDDEVNGLFQFGMNIVHHRCCSLTHIEPQPDE